MSVLNPQVPLASTALIDHLDKCYPDRSADLGWTDREVWFKAGQASVIRKLKSDVANHAHT